MKYLIVFALLLGGCSDSTSSPGPRNTLPSGIGKFTDGNVVCYIYYQNSISCIKMTDPKECKL